MIQKLKNSFILFNNYAFDDNYYNASVPPIL